jgi:iron complex outermembrane recepter protein
MVLVSLAGGNIAAAADPTATNNLTSMSLEDLMNIKVSILGPTESVSKTPAAVSVVTQDDIRRSGAMNIPEALRLVPGLDVAQLDSSQWAVSARGFNDVFANKLLVMQDGRSIYTPLFSGVFWDVQGTLMQDIDRIEVIRGPGATLWGANAMNGVINIITKNAKDTQGLLVYSGGGTQDRGFGGVRYGGKINDDAYYRVYATYENHASTVLSDGSDADNSWQLARAGFRTDWNPTDNNTFTFQGDGYAGWINQVFGTLGPPPTYMETNFDDMTVSGANTLGRWTHTFSETSNLKLQAYYDYTEREAANIFDEQRQTFDLDARHEFALGYRNKVDWGMDYRVTADVEGNNPTIAFNPDRQTVNLYSAFAQDDLALVKNRLSLTFGSKFEDNDFTGFEIEPGARLLWTPTDRQTFWASVSRAVRTPSRAEESILLTQSEQVSPGVYAPITISGTNTFKSEDMIAYEIGYRTAPWNNLSFDVTAFFNDYNHLRSEDPTGPESLTLENNLFGHTYGVEATATWRVLDWWRLTPSYTFLHTKLFAHPDSSGYSDNTTVAQIEGSSPQNQFSLRSSMNLPHNVSLDLDWRYVDHLPYYQIDGYFELDARLGWHITKNVETAIVGQNLLHDQHQEFSPSYIDTRATEIPRSFYAEVTWRF